MPNLNDPRITAYAMNEMTDTEKAEFEKVLAQHPDMAEAVLAIQETGQVLQFELKNEPAPVFDFKTAEEGEGATGDALMKEKPSSFWSRFRIPVYVFSPLAVAACIYLVARGPLQPEYQKRSGLRTESGLPIDLVEPNQAKTNQGRRNAKPESRSTVSKEIAPAPTEKPVTVAALEESMAESEAPMAEPMADMEFDSDDSISVAKLERKQDFADQAAPAKRQKDYSRKMVSKKKKSLGKSARIRPKNLPTLEVGRNYYGNKPGTSGRGSGGGQLGGLHSGMMESSALEGKPTSSIAPHPPVDTPNDQNLQQTEPYNREAYDHIAENEFKKVSDHPLSTFSVDVDTASYANIRRMLNYGQLPPPSAVRIEEMINYFDYNYAGPKGNTPVAVHTEMHNAPWNEKNHLLKIGMKAKEIQWNSKGSNLVFLLDVSGSMRGEDRLGLVKNAMRMLVNNLTEKDRVAIVVYAGSSGMVLDSTSGDKKADILAALEKLHAGGSTNGGAGIELAYKTAKANFIKGGVNRVVLATDGDFNVGVTSKGSLVELVKEKAKTGVFLSVLGFGSGNLQDDRMESLANKGNGNYNYIDSIKEAKKVLVEEMGGTLVTVAKDVKLQIEFNPAKVAGYRLVGYENRMLAKEDFNNDKKDAGEMGAGHTVTAIYEIVPAGGKVEGSVDALKYQKPKADAKAAGQFSDEWLTVKVRYKEPSGDTSKLFAQPHKGESKKFANASDDFKFASAVAGFGMLLRKSKHSGTANFDSVREWAIEGKGEDRRGYRQELIQMIDKAKSLKGSK